MSILKRVLLGKPVSSHEELHHRLPKRIALAVFSSDALSSSAYATDEIFLVLILAGAAATSLSLPVGIAVSLVLIIVIASYRQTVRAYPHGGGAYIVAHENLGRLPGLTAASALLIDYVLTVSVSVAAGVTAVIAAFPHLEHRRMGMALGVVVLITVLNLRGLKESGTIFAIPTYGFLIAMGVMIVLGIYKVVTGGMVPYPDSHLEAQQGIGVFLVLWAFSSGCTALTGVEAISDGVPAFQPPESKNAAQTLLTLGILLTFLFLGITVLAHYVNVDAHLIEEHKTIPSQIAAKVFGAGSPPFYILQAFTALILFLAANTSYADFPRLASILARDRYLPRALRNRGDRLAFSNGIIILAAAAMGILVAFKANVHSIIPLYVIGVFTSFTLSQAGMVVRWVRLGSAAAREGSEPPPNWKRSAAVNGVGAFTTFVVLIVVSITKFKSRDVSMARFFTEPGAWMVMILMAIVAFALYRINTHYRQVAQQLRDDPTAPKMESYKALLVVSSRWRGATKALAFTRAIGPEELRVAAFGASPERIRELRERWDSMGVHIPIEPVGRGLKSLIAFVRDMGPTIEEPVTVVLPDPQYSGVLQQLINNRLLLRMKRRFLVEPGVVVISVPFQPETEQEPTRFQSPGRLSIVVLVPEAVNRATVMAINYSRSLHPSELKGLSIQTDLQEAETLLSEWRSWKIDAPLEIVDAPYRDVIDTLVKEVREMGPNPNDAVGVVVPEFVVTHWWQNVLHNQTALLIKTRLLFEPNVVVINVPYRVRRGASKVAPAGAKTPER